MNKKTAGIYICIIIVVFSIFQKPRSVQAECLDTISKVYAVMVDSAAQMNSPEAANIFLSRMFDILFSRNVTQCDENGNPVIAPTQGPIVVNPTTDPNGFPTPNPNISPPPGDGSFAFFCQTDPAVQDKTSPYLNPSVSSYGCGPTSMSMIYCSQGGYDNNSRMSCPNSPVAFGDIMKSRTCNGKPCYSSQGITFYNETGTNSPGVVNVLKEMGKHVEIIPADLVEWEKKTREGYLLLTYSPDTPCAEGCAAPRNRKLAHVFVVDHVDLSTGSVRLRDPINCGGSSSYAEIGGGRILFPIATQTTYAAGSNNFQIKVAFAIK